MLSFAILFTLISIQSLALAQDTGQPYTFTAAQIETSRVNSNGQRHDQTKVDCFTSAGAPFQQNAFVASEISSSDADVKSCTLSFRDDVEYIPGIFEPKTVCLTSYVVSVGGLINIGKSGRLTCSMTGRYVSMPAITATQEMSYDSAPTVPTLPANLSLERSKRSLVTVSVPLAMLQYHIDSSLAKQVPDLPVGFSVKVMSSRFDNVLPDNRMLGYYVDLDISGPIGARCEVSAKFSIPASSLDLLQVQDVGSTADCRIGSLLGQLANLPTLLNKAIRKSITDTLSKKLLSDNETLADWRKEDPELAAFLQRALLQGAYCNWREQPGLCIRIGWAKRDAVADYETTLMSKAPVSTGSVDRKAASEKRDLFRSIALKNHMAATSAGVRYPSGRLSDGTVEDGDMAIFGGLLCRSGEEEGCKLLRNAASGGRFWRSPNRVNEPDTTDHASFSGDQMKGVLHYFVTTGDKRRLGELLDYLRSKPTKVPADTLPLETGYSSCPNYAPNFTCMIGGSDWHVLRLLAHKHGLTSRLPADLPAIESRYGFDYNTLLWESMLTNSGYRLHLVANTIWLLKSLDVKDKRLDKALAMIASRQPSNPFFRYLAVGPDKKGQELTDAQCLAPEDRKDYSDWGWQRADSVEAWKRSMVWDCVFMYGLLGS